MSFKDIFTFIFVPQFTGFQLFFHILTSLLIPAFILLIDFLCKTISINLKKENGINLTITNEIVNEQRVLVKTINKYDDYYFYDSLPSALLSNNIWGLTFIPMNVNESLNTPILITYFLFFGFTIVLYVLSFFGFKQIKIFIKIEKFYLIITLLMTYFLIVIMPKL